MNEGLGGLVGEARGLTMDIAATMALYAALFFGAGWGWGQWWAERCSRQEKRGLEAGRILVSMPARPDDAAASLRMLADLVSRAEAQRGEAAVCWCECCDEAANNGMRTRMAVCPECGDKRCPRAEFHGSECQKTPNV